MSQAEQIAPVSVITGSEIGKVDPMQKARQTLLQIGMFILCFNGVWWFISNTRQGPPAFGQLMFRFAVFLLGLALVGTGGLLVVIEKLQATPNSDTSPESEVIDESDLIDAEAGEQEEETE